MLSILEAFYTIKNCQKVKCWIGTHIKELNNKFYLHLFLLQSAKLKLFSEENFTLRCSRAGANPTLFLILVFRWLFNLFSFFSGALFSFSNDCFFFVIKFGADLFDILVSFSFFHEDFMHGQVYVLKLGQNLLSNNPQKQFCKPHRNCCVVMALGRTK